MYSELTIPLYNVISQGVFLNNDLIFSVFLDYRMDLLIPMGTYSHDTLSSLPETVHRQYPLQVFLLENLFGNNSNCILFSCKALFSRAECI